MALAATDSVVAAPYLPVVVRRTYNSQGVPSGSFGDNWRLNADWTVQDFGSYAVLTTGDGGEHVYTFDGVNYHGDTLWYWTLSKDGSGNFQLTRPDRMLYHFGSAGQLASIVERNGNTITYNYSGNRLASITDPVGRTTTLSYDAQGRLTGSTDGAGRSIQYGYDTAGRLASVTDAEGWTSTYQYDAAGRLVYAADPSGRWTAFTYDDTGRVTSVTDPLGNRSTLAYSTSGSGGGTTDVTDPLGARTTFAYDSHGFLTSLTDAYQNTQPTPRSWSYSYTYMAGDATKLQTLAITNLRGLQTQLTYDSTGNVTQATDQGTDLTAPGVTIRSSSLSYLSGSSDLSSVTDPESNATTNTWSAAAPFRLLSVADALGNTVQYSYSDNPAQPGWITGITDARGNATQFSYDSLGNVTRTTNAVYLGDTLKTLAVSMTYYGDGSVQDISEMHDVNSASYPVTHTDYDKLGRRIRVEYPDGSAEAVIYDPAGQVAVATTRGGQQGRYSYDGAGRLSSVTDNAGNTTSYSYDAAGNATSITDALGHATTLQYDALHRVTRRQDASGMVTLTAYDEMGNAVSTTRGDQSIVAGNGYTVTASYYQTGLLRSISEPLRSDSVLPNSGSPPAAGTTVYNVQSLQYNRVGKATQSTDGGNMATTYQYDSAYRLLKVNDARGGMTEYAYDASGNRTDVWDAEHTRVLGASSTHFAFDALGRQVSVTDPLGNVVSQVYDEAGNVAQRTEPRTSGTLTTTYGYDLGHRLASISYPNLTGRGPVSQTQYVYDGGGRRLYRRDDYGIARYGYDALGRLAQVISRQENDSFNYDAVGNRTGVTYSIGTVSYAYDAANRMTSVSDPLGNTTTYSYDNYGHISQVALPGGIKRSVSFWALPGGGPTTDRIQSLSNTNSSGSTTFWAGTYQYDYVGNVRNINATWTQHPTPYDITASYDNLYRLTQWADNSVADAATRTSYFSYDAAGNRLRWGNLNDTGTNNFKTPVGNTVSQNATFDAANRTVAQNTAMRNNWTQLNPASPGQSTTYEGNGNTSVERYIYSGSSSNFDAYLGYDYDDANRLTRYSGELHDTTNGWLDQEYYSYDGDGRRLSWDGHLCVPYPGVQCTGSNVVNNYKEYEYVGSEQVAERHENGATPLWYVLGQGGEKLYALHLRTDTWALSADVYVKDHLGSIREVVEPSGNVANWYDYDAFGLPKAQTTTLANSYQFASAPLDVLYRNSTTGYASFYNLKARLYSPLVGRFLTQDSYRGNPWAPWTQNLYAYVGNNPVNYIDPTGHRQQLISTPGGDSDNDGATAIQAVESALNSADDSTNSNLVGSITGTYGCQGAATSLDTYRGAEGLGLDPQVTGYSMTCLVETNMNLGVSTNAGSQSMAGVFGRVTVLTVSGGGGDGGGGNDDNNGSKKLEKTTHALLGGADGRPVAQAINDLQRARRADILIQPSDGRWIVLGPNRRVHIIEADGSKVVTSFWNPASNTVGRIESGRWAFPTQSQLDSFFRIFSSYLRW